MNYILKIPISIFLCEKSPNDFPEKSKMISEQKIKPIEEKITSVLLFEQYLIAGFENGIISMWKLDTNEKSHIPILVKKYEFCNEILFLFPFKATPNNDKLLCIDSQGIGFIITFNEKGIINEELRKTKIAKDPENNKIRLIACKIIFDNYVTFVYKSGKIEIWSKNFDSLINEIDFNKKILYFDSILSTENNQDSIKFLCVTKEKSKHTLLSSFLSKNDLDYLYNSKKNMKEKAESLATEEKEKPEMKLGNIRCEITLDFHLTENYIKNKDDLKQASVCAKFLNSQEVTFFQNILENLLLKYV